MSDYCPGAVRVPQPGGGGLDTSLPPRAVWHITWDALKPDGSQPQYSAVANYLKNQGYCPHLMWNPFTGYIEQYYPASQSARALAAWNGDGAACVQIEVFFTPGCVVDGVKYATVADTPCRGLGTILDWLDGLGIPRTWPLGPPQWQGNSRDPNVWNSKGGHYGHCNVPDNTHTDPGPMPNITGTITTPSTTITPEDIFMALTEDEQRRILAAADRLINAADRPHGKLLTTDPDHLDAVANAVLRKDVPWYGFDGKDQPEGQRNTVNLAAVVGWLDSSLVNLAGRINGVQDIVKSLPQQPTKVELTEADLAGLATQLKTVLAPGLASDLARRLAE